MVVVGDRVEAPATGRFMELCVGESMAEPGRWEVLIRIGHEGGSCADGLGVPMKSFDRAVKLAAELRAQLANDFREAEEARSARFQVARKKACSTGLTCYAHGCAGECK